MESITRLSESARCFLDHGKNEEDRSIKNLVGVFENTKLIENRISADLIYHPAFSDFLEGLIERFPNMVGLSICGSGTYSDPSKTVVEDITTLYSVDLVSRPASTTGLFENFVEESLSDVKTDEVEELGDLRFSEIVKHGLKGATILREQRKKKKLEIPEDVFSKIVKNRRYFV